MDRALRAAQQQLDSARNRYGCAWLRSIDVIAWLTRRGIR